MLLLPVVFVVILYRYPAGLLVYWITTNMWTIGQQYLIRRHMPPPPKPDPAVANGKPRTSLRAALAGATAGAASAPKSGAVAAPGPSATPPRPPRKKKKRSGRRR
jgi:YidC/Oxa1 family membrane protein insertase